MLTYRKFALKWPLECINVYFSSQFAKFFPGDLPRTPIISPALWPPLFKLLRRLCKRDSSLICCLNSNCCYVSYFISLRAAGCADQSAEMLTRQQHAGVLVGHFIPMTSRRRPAIHTSRNEQRHSVAGMKQGTAPPPPGTLSIAQRNTTQWPSFS